MTAHDPDALIERLHNIQARVQAAVRTAGRAKGEVTLVAVSKRHPPEAIRVAYLAGQRDFGENYAQELDAKRQALSDLPDIRWHFIGALQSNKAKLVVPGCTLVHAVDRISTAEALSRRAQLAGVTARILLEVNVGDESTKAGIKADEVEKLLEEMSRLPAIEAAGLMCIPPPAAQEQNAGVYFRTLRDLRDRLLPTHPSLRLLSMGMTDDFEDAIAAGATHVRIGTAIFGARPRG